MNMKDVAEIKRRLNPEKVNATVIRGCYVSADGQILSSFALPMGAMPKEECEKYMALFKKVFSGTLGQNLLNIDFKPEQVLHGEEHRLLTVLRDSALQDCDASDAFFGRVIAAHPVEDPYLILLMHDGYDVPFKNQNGEIDREQSTGVFNYFLCAVCPVKKTKETLSFFAQDGAFHTKEGELFVAVPELGFLFPAFEERAANIYGALYFSKNPADVHDKFIEEIFNTNISMPALEQKEKFREVLTESLESDCSLDVVQSVHEKVRDLLEDQKEQKIAEPLQIDRRQVSQVLSDCGVSKEHVDAFEEKYAEAFGEYAVLDAAGVVTPKRFELKAPGVSIKVDPAHSDWVQTRVIDGLNYILIRADNGVEVNGVNVCITDEDSEEGDED